MKNNLELCKFCEEAQKEGCGYVWGTFGKILTNSLLESKVKQYAHYVGENENFIRSNWMGKRTMDCAGLIKAFLWDSNGTPIYTPSSDYNVGMFANASTRKGLIKDIPLAECGLMVWKSGHIGVYVGDGRVIEAHNTYKGVIETPVSGTGATAWTHWGECHLLEYLEKQNDYENRWSTENIKKCLDTGLMSGYSDGSFKPTQQVTREEIATALVNMYYLIDSRINLD